MLYATADDIIDLYGADALYVADRDRDGEADMSAVDRALVSASDEIDSYLAVRYTLPLGICPGILRQHGVDIAVYRLALSADVLTEEHRRRYDDAIAHLRRIADGKAALVLPAPDPGEDGADLSGSAQPIVVGGPPRVWSREKMRDL